MITIVQQRIIKKLMKFKIMFFAKNEPKSFYHFAYGANMNQSYFSSLGICSEYMGVAVLKDHKFSFCVPCEYLLKGFGGVNSSPGDEVYGALYRISISSLKYLDILEWVPFYFYTRVDLPVHFNNMLIKAQVYVPNFPKKNLFPSTVYKKMILKAATDMNLPADYISFLDSFNSYDFFRIDHEFNLANPSKSRFLPKVLRMWNDNLREKLARLI